MRYSEESRNTPLHETWNLNSRTPRVGTQQVELRMHISRLCCPDMFVASPGVALCFSICPCVRARTFDAELPFAFERFDPRSCLEVPSLLFPLYHVYHTRLFFLPSCHRDSVAHTLKFANALSQRCIMRVVPNALAAACGGCSDVVDELNCIRCCSCAGHMVDGSAQCGAR